MLEQRTHIYLVHTMVTGFPCIILFTWSYKQNFFFLFLLTFYPCYLDYLRELFVFEGVLGSGTSFGPASVSKFSHRHAL